MLPFSLNEEDINIYMNNYVKNSENIHKIIINTDVYSNQDVTKIINLFSDNLFDITYLIGICKLFKLSLKKNWEFAYDEIIKYNNKILLNQDLFYKMKTVYDFYKNNKKCDTITLLLLEKILNNFIVCGIQNKMVQNIFNDITILESNLLKNIEMGERYIDSSFYSDLFNLIHLRHIYANKLNHNNFTIFKLKDVKYDMEYVNYQISQFVNGIDCSLELQEITNIKKSSNLVQISINDISEYFAKKNLNNLINIDYALTQMFKILNELFNLDFIQDTSCGKLWDPSVKLYKIFYNKQNVSEQCGYIYIDLNKKYGKPLNPISIIINETTCYPQNSNTIKIPTCALVANFCKEVYPNQVASLFSEFGNIVHTIFHRSKYFTLNIEDDMKFFMKGFFDYIIKDPFYLSKIYNDKTTVIKDLFDRSLVYQIKYLCINSFFDSFVHEGFLEKEKDADKKKIFVNIYKNLYRNCMEKEIKKLNISFNITKIPIDVLKNIICQPCFCHSYILNSNRLASNLYKIIKSQNLFSDFAETVLRETVLPLKDALLLFTDKIVEKQQCIKTINSGIKKDSNINKITDNKNEQYNPYILDETEQINYYTETDIESEKIEKNEISEINEIKKCDNINSALAIFGQRRIR